MDNFGDIISSAVSCETGEAVVVAFNPVEVQKTYETPTYVHYMPWFETPEFSEFGNSAFNDWGIHWTMANRNPEIIDSNGKREIASHYYPLIGPYDSGDPHYLEYAVLTIKLSGLDGVLIDNPGITDVYDGTDVTATYRRYHSLVGKSRVKVWPRV